MCSAYFSLVLLVIFLTLPRTLETRGRLAPVLWYDLSGFLQFVLLPLTLLIWGLCLFLYNILKFINLFFLASGFHFIDYQHPMCREAFSYVREFENFHFSWLNFWSVWNLCWCKVWGTDPTWNFPTGSTLQEMTGPVTCMVCAYRFWESQPAPQEQTGIQKHHWVCLFVCF